MVIEIRFDRLDSIMEGIESKIESTNLQNPSAADDYLFHACYCF